MPTRCVRCGESHHKDDCPRDRNAPATCANCNKPHPASSKSCTHYLVALRKLSRSTKQPLPEPTRRPTPQTSATPAAHAKAATPAPAAVPARPASTGVPSYAAAAASKPTDPAPAQQPQSAAPKKKKLKKTLATVSKQPQDAASQPPSAPVPKEPRQPKTKAPASDNGIMFRLPPPTPVAAPAAAESSDSTFANRLRAWVETVIPQILAAKDIQLSLIHI